MIGFTKSKQIDIKFTVYRFFHYFERQNHATNNPHITALTKLTLTFKTLGIIPKGVSKPLRSRVFVNHRKLSGQLKQTPPIYFHLYLPRQVLMYRCY